MKGDNAGWVEDIDFSFLLSPLLCSPPCWWFNVLTFSHFFFPIYPAFFDPSLRLCLCFSACTLLSIFHFMYLTLHPHTHYLSLLFFLRSRCSGGDSQCSTICSDRWRSGTPGFHRHLCPHCHHLVLRPTER